MEAAKTPTGLGAPRIRRRRRQDPRGVNWAILTGWIGIVFVGLTIVTAVQWEHSRRAQGNRPVTATVLNIASGYDDGGGSVGPGQLITTVKLRLPDGKTSTLRQDGIPYLLDPTTLQVVVDPDNPGTAEVPQEPGTTGAYVVKLLVVSLVAVVVTVGLAVRRRRYGRRIPITTMSS